MDRGFLDGRDKSAAESVGEPQEQEGRLCGLEALRRSPTSRVSQRREFVSTHAEHHWPGVAALCVGL
jgi:hypothetical protein